MSEEITREDWEKSLKQHEDFYVNNTLNAEFHKVVVEHCKKKISEFPEPEKTEDPMPEEVKEVLEEVAK